LPALEKVGINLLHDFLLSMERSQKSEIRNKKQKAKCKNQKSKELLLTTFPLPSCHIIAAISDMQPKI